MGLSAGAIAAIGAGVSAAGAVGGAVISSQAASSAAGKQAAAARQAASAAQSQNADNTTNLNPYDTAGQGSIGQLLAALGQPSPGPTPGTSYGNPLVANGLTGLTFQPTQASLESTPGYQFDLAQGLQSTQNSNAARGLGVSGAALKGAASYATGLANNTLSTQAGIYNQNVQNVMNPIEYAGNLGENAAAQTGAQGNQATQNANLLNVGGANAQAAGIVGSANALSSGFSNAASGLVNYAMFNSLLSQNAGGSAGTGSGNTQGFG